MAQRRSICAHGTHLIDVGTINTLDVPKNARGVRVGRDPVKAGR